LKAWHLSDYESSKDEVTEQVANLCFMALSDDEDSENEVEEQPWYVDSGCSKHMTGDKSLFIDVKEVDGGKVTFGDNKKAKICGIGSIGNKFSTLIENVSYVVGLRHNLLSVSQLCDK
ncbi:hypothetical protein CFOL_v3_28755, partial [Cephalotus follicularis]